MIDPLERQLSALDLLSTLIRRWRPIALFAFLGGALGIGLAWNRPALYRAYTTFASQAGDQGRLGLANLAGQFGISIPGSGQSLSPEYYARLATSRALLLTVARDSFQIDGPNGPKKSFADVFNVQATDSATRAEQEISLLTAIVGTGVSRQTGIIELSAKTRWKNVSLQIVDKLVRAVNGFNEASRQAQAKAEREFIEGRLSLATTELETAENHLQDVQRSNRQFNAASEVNLEFRRAQADVDQRRQLVTSLSQAYEEARLREVRNTPVIAMVEMPTVPAIPEPRGRLKTAAIGVFVGFFLASLLVLIGDTVERRRAAGDPTMIGFLNAVASLRRDIVSPARWFSRSES